MEAYEIDGEVEKVYKSIKFDKIYRIASFKIVKKRIVVDEVGERHLGPNEALAYFPENECRYIIWDVDYSSKYTQTAKIYFLTWIPQQTPSNHQLIYRSQQGKELSKIILGAAEHFVKDYSDLTRVTTVKFDVVDIAEADEDNGDWIDA